MADHVVQSVGPVARPTRDDEWYRKHTMKNLHRIHDFLVMGMPGMRGRELPTLTLSNGGDATELNNLWYCEAHGRDACFDCRLDYGLPNYCRGFVLPSNGQPQYPRIVTQGDLQLSESILQRWLEFQRVLSPGEPTAEKFTGIEPPATQVDVSLIRLPAAQALEEEKTSGTALQASLLLHFRLVLGMATEQRYFTANQARIMLQDFDTFSQAAVLYEEHLSTIMRAQARFVYESVPQSVLEKHFDAVRRGRASILTTLGFFLGLNTQRSFWRCMETTAEAFVMHVERYDEAIDGDKVIEKEAKPTLLEWLGHVFWALQLSQYRLDDLRALQHRNYQTLTFPFYPSRSKEALEAGLDIHLLIARFCRAPMYDFPLVSSLFRQFGDANKCREQMQDVNVEAMAVIDELSTRFRVMEALIHAARLVATEGEIKAAMVCHVFQPRGREVNCKGDVVFHVINQEHGTPVMTSHRTNYFPGFRIRTAERVSFLQQLMIKENLFFQNRGASFVPDDVTILEPEARFVDFKDRYMQLYHGSLRREFKASESSLLPLEVTRRHEHRKEYAKKNKKKTVFDVTRADTSESRFVSDSTCLDPSSFWEVGDGSLERYVQPVVREKVKTRKQPQGPDTMEIDEELQDSGFVEEVAPTSVRGVKRPLDQLKEDDLRTRDILWRKAKGILKWTSVLQFLTRLGCSVLSRDGSKKKVVDPFSGRCTVLHMPHPSDDCRPDQADSYRMHIEDWLKIRYGDILPDADKRPTKMKRR